MENEIEKKSLKWLWTIVILAVIIFGIYGMVSYSNKFLTDPLNRKSYGISLATFENMPPIPEDFKWVKEQVSMGTIDEKRFNAITEEFWKQPEFYPNFVEVGLQFYRTPYTDRRNCYGYGAYPQSMGNIVPQENLSVGTELYSKTWLHTGFGIVCYQGTQLIPMTSEKENEYFDVIIDPNLFLLMPTYPKFDKDWAREIRYIVKVKKAPVPKGSYSFSFVVSSPPSKQNDDWKWQYKQDYASSGMFSSSAKTFEFVVQVV